MSPRSSANSETLGRELSSVFFSHTILVIETMESKYFSSSNSRVESSSSTAAPVVEAVPATSTASSSSPCTICLNDVVAIDAGHLPCCEHVFCYTCISQWCQVATSCPLCKREFDAIVRRRGDGMPGERVAVEPRSAADTIVDDEQEAHDAALAASLVVVDGDDGYERDGFVVDDEAAEEEDTYPYAGGVDTGDALDQAMRALAARNERLPASRGRRRSRRERRRDRRARRAQAGLQALVRLDILTQLSEDDDDAAAHVVRHRRRRIVRAAEEEEPARQRRRVSRSRSTRSSSSSSSVTIDLTQFAYSYEIEQ